MNGRPLVSSSGVFPAQAGVIPYSVINPPPTAGIPRASGGDPGSLDVFYKIVEYSPRKRG